MICKKKNFVDNGEGVATSFRQRALLACVAVAKLSKALAWFSCVRSRERPEFKA